MDDLYETMKRRMTAVQSGQADPGAGGTPTAAPGSAPAGTPGAPAQTVPGQAGAAQTYSATPGATPTPTTTNQGTQDVVRNSYLQQATQGTAINRNDPNFKQQTDAFGATQDRARGQYASEAAERLSAKGLGNSGAMQQEQRLADERAATAKGGFEAQLVGRELENRRNEIQQSLGNLRGMISGDQQLALQKELAQLDAQLKQAGIDQSGSLGAQELALKNKLGTGGLNIDLMRLLQQGQQFGDTMGFNVADRTAHWNNVALQNLM